MVRFLHKVADAAKIPHSNNHNHALCKETPFMWFMVIVSIKLTHKLNILSEIVLTKLIYIPVKPSYVDLLDFSFDYFHNCWHLEMWKGIPFSIM